MVLWWSFLCFGWLVPLLTQATGGLWEGSSAAVHVLQLINDDDEKLGRSSSSS